MNRLPFGVRTKRNGERERKRLASGSSPVQTGGGGGGGVNEAFTVLFCLLSQARQF